MSTSLFHKIFYTCKDASIKVLKKDHKKLSIFGKIRLKIHVWVCGECDEFEKQNELINEGLKIIGNGSAINGHAIPEQKKKEMADMIASFQDSVKS